VKTAFFFKQFSVQMLENREHNENNATFL